MEAQSRKQVTSVAKARKQRTTARQMEDLPLAPEDAEEPGSKAADEGLVEEKRAPCATRSRKPPGTPA
jgi:hypothetical protein